MADDPASSPAPKRKVRKPRKRAMPGRVRKRADAAIAKHHERFAIPEIRITGDFDAWEVTCPYIAKPKDLERWEALLYEAFGTRSVSTANVFLAHLMGMVRKDWDEADKQWRPNIPQLNAAIGLIASVQPQNEAEAALAAQMVALHFTAMGMAGNCANRSYPDERTAASLARVSKAYASLSRTLAELQGKLQPRAFNQTIQVIHVDQRDQRQQTAVVGGGGNFGGQAHASPYSANTLTHEGITHVAGSSTDARCAAMPSPCQDYGPAMPLAGVSREARLPDARWLTRVWRAIWRA